MGHTMLHICMYMISEKVLICPICKESLKEQRRSFLCKNRHCFDVAKEGYINLLLCNKKKSKSPGDDKIMVSARNEFLQKGYFEQLRKKIELLVKENCPSLILDAGCGTGFYTQNLQDEFNIISIDISKEAARYTSKNNKKSLVIVSSIFDMPIKDKVVGVILNIFAPKPQAEFARILEKNGIIIEVVPGEDHLKELKEKIFNENNELNQEKFAFNNFDLKKSMRLKYAVTIKETGELIDLLKMTPYFYKGGYGQLKRLQSISNLEVTMDFIINIWEAI